MTVPYTYLIKCIPENCFYYGVRYAKNCSPSDLWIKYFTSSKTIKKKIKQYGKNAFAFEIRKTFDNYQTAILWETRVLSKLKVLKRSDFYNKTTNKAFEPMYGDQNPSTKEKTKNKIRETLKTTAVRGNKHPRKINPEKYAHIGSLLSGRKNYWSEGEKNPMHRIEVKEKFFNMRGTHPNNGRIQSTEEKEQRRQSNLGKTRKKYTCIYCNKNIAKNMLLKWHGDNCKYKGDSHD